MPSAAEPTHPEHPTPEHSPPAPAPHSNVIQLGKRSGVRRGRRHPTPTVPPAQPVTPQQQLAETVEATFHRSGRTLTDEPTAHAYRITLSLVHLMLEGAQATGVVDDAQHETLHNMIEGMVDAPREL